MHLPGLIHDLALILMTAGVVTLTFRRLKQPVVLGYLLAGFLVGPHFSQTPTVTDLPNIQIWSEIGIIFLLFALGLEFSFKKLAKVGGSAGITASIEVVFMVAIGYATGLALGWSSMDSLFLGGVLAISSTTIIIRAFEEAGVKAQGFVSLVFGVLIVEDLIAILLLVLLSTVAVSNSFAGGELIASALKLVFFLTLWFLGGIFLVPTFLRKAKPWINPETLLVMACGACFGMVVFATKVGFSPALGAFITGSILAETVEAEKIEHLISPVKDLFAAVFFVSVGMLINPEILIKYAGPIAVITVVTIAGKILSTTFGSLLSGRSVKHSVQAGFSLAQIGEFSFIIAGLGLSLKVTSDFLYPIAVSVSALTTFCTPYLIRSSGPIAERIERSLPERWRHALTNYSRNSGNVAATSEWSQLVQDYATGFLIFGTLISATFFLVGLVVPRLLILDQPLEDWKQVVCFISSLGLAAPFLWALAIRKSSIETTASLKSRARVQLAMLEIVRVILASVLIGILGREAFDFSFWMGSAVGLSAILVFAYSRNLNYVYSVIEKRFFKNLGERDSLIDETSAARSGSDELILTPWDAHVVWFTVPPDSPWVARSLGELNIRSRFGVMVTMIERGKKRVLAPGTEERLYPLDRLAMLGNDEELHALRVALETESRADTDDIPSSHYALRQVELRESSDLIGKSVRDAEIRTRTHGLLVGIERHGKRMLNPDSSTVLESGDQLWIVGEPSAIRKLGF